MALDRLVALALLIVATADTAHAGGQEYADNATKALARGGAFVAKADDPSALYYNPAGLAKLHGTQILIDARMLRYQARFQREGEYGEYYREYENADTGDSFRGLAGTRFPQVGTDQWMPVPFLSIATDLGWRDDLTFGIGFFGPPGAGRKDFGVCSDPVSDQYPCPVESFPGPQRYDSVSLEGISVFSTVGAGYRISDRWSAGLAFAWVYTKVKSRSVALALSEFETHANDVVATVEVEDKFAPSGFGGVTFAPNDSWELGASFRLPVFIRAHGESRIQLSGELASTGAGAIPREGPCSDLYGDRRDCPLDTTVDTVFPLIARAGARWILRDAAGRERADIELDLTYETWSMLDAQTVHTDAILVSESRAAGEPVPVPVIKQQLHLRDTMSVRLGGTHRVGRIGSGDLAVSLGGYYDSAAAPTEWTRLSTDGLAKVGVAGGLSYRTRRTELTLGSAYIHSLSRTVTDSKVVPILAKDQERETLPVVGNGTYEGSILIFGAGLTMAFGAD